MPVKMIIFKNIFNYHIDPIIVVIIIIILFDTITTVVIIITGLKYYHCYKY